MSTTKEKIADLKARHEKLAKGGGDKAISIQHEKGKLTARERIDFLFDEGTFKEVDVFVTHRSNFKGMQGAKTPSDGVVTGYGTISGRLVFIYAQDFTVMGGSLGEMHEAKITKVQDMALKMGAPIIGINDSGGARIQEGVSSLIGLGNMFYRNTIASGVIPQLSIIMGPSAGGAVYSPALTDFVFMVDGSSKMFITGPQVIKTVTGEQVDAESLGGSVTHNRISGVAHFRSANDQECLETVKELLSFLPSNNLEDPPRFAAPDNLDQFNPALDAIVPDSPNQSYDMRDIIAGIVDDGNYFQVHQEFAQNVLTVFARLNGKTIGIIANQPMHLAGCLDINASDKAARFIRFLRCLQHSAAHPGGCARLFPRHHSGAQRDHPPRRQGTLCLCRSHGTQGHPGDPERVRRRLHCHVQQGPGRRSGLCLAVGRNCGHGPGGCSQHHLSKRDQGR